MFVVGKITHIESGRYYICKTTQTKWARGYTGSGTVIRAMVAKYGVDAFTREVISTHTSEREAYGAEQFEIGLKFELDPFCINLRGGGQGSFIGARQEMSKERRAKISAALKGNTNSKGRKLTPIHRARIGKSNKGKKHKPPTPETRAKISAAHKGKKKSPQHRANIIAGLKGKPKPHTRKSFTLRGKQFYGIREAMDWFKVSHATIHRWRNKERRTP